ncbi:helix-turn-helix domain-containing protein [Mycobacterium sp. M26]|uniref:winged helix-turn-helix transcriptional regulator n=1 Tax=Mycobacterium sp. M26 TaxID=1762962 RepID=UPI000B03FC3C
MQKTYSQNCPVAMGMDVLGERWTMLILRELFGGPRRYSDLRAELPGIATNLLADRLRALEEGGLVERKELPPPAARIVYELTDEGWRKVAPVIKAIAVFGMGRIDGGDLAGKPLTGFLAGIIAGFDPTSAAEVVASYQIYIDERLFEFSVDRGELAPPGNPVAVTVKAAARDLLALRVERTATRRRAAWKRIDFRGEPAAVADMQRIFALRD